MQGPDLAHTRLVVVGSVNVDRVYSVPQLPVPGETVIATGDAVLMGGKGANQAVDAAALSAGVAFVGAVGDDAAGADARASLIQAGVDTSRLVTEPAPTGTATIVVDDAGENTIVLRRGANALLSPGHVQRAIRALATADTMVVASLEVPLDAVEAAALAARGVGARFVLNPAPGRALDTSLLGRCDVLVPNAVELRQVASSVQAILHAGVGALVVTRGREGAQIVLHDGEPTRVPAPLVNVLDTTGAGDAFVAALAVALVDGLPLLAAVRVAVAAGALATTGVGAQGTIPTREAVGAVLGSVDPPTGRGAGNESIDELVAAWAASGTSLRPSSRQSV